MTFLKFVSGLLLTIGIVGLWSYFSDASWTLILVRLAITAVVLQVGYFAYVAAKVAAEVARRADDTERSAEASRHATKRKFS